MTFSRFGSPNPCETERSCPTRARRGSDSRKLRLSGLRRLRRCGPHHSDAADEERAGLDAALVHGHSRLEEVELRHDLADQRQQGHGF